MRGVIEFEFNRPFEINTPTRISTEKDVKDKTSTWFFPQFTERLQVENLLQQSKKKRFFDSTIFPTKFICIVII